MINGKQRAYLRGLANGIDPVFQIGKGGITDEIIKQLKLVLDARELIKVHILETAFLDTKETCNLVAERLNAEPVQAIGAKFVIYRRSDNVKNRKIELPKINKKK